MGFESENIKYLLWHRKIDKFNWIKQLQDWFDDEIALSILSGDQETLFTTDQLAQVAKALNEDATTIRSTRMLEARGVNILTENLSYLIEANLGKRKNKWLAETIGIGEVALSNWLTGKKQPHETNLKRLKEIFHVASEIDLTAIPLFLSLDYLGMLEIREWLKRSIDNMDENALRSYFPALKKLLEI